MSDTRKSRQPGVEPPRLEPPRFTRDPRIDSTPPAALDETPLATPRHPHIAHTFSRPPAAPPSARLAGLEAEVERLRGELATDADDTAGMLVRIAESERMHITSHALAVEAGARAGALEADLDRAQRRVRELELELAGLRQQGALSEAHLGAARHSMDVALTLIEELDRREEMAASIRARTVREALRALRIENAPVSAKSSVEVAGARDVAGEPEWDLDLAK